MFISRMLIWVCPIQNILPWERSLESDEQMNFPDSALNHASNYETKSVSSTTYCIQYLQLSYIKETLVNI